MNTEQLEIPVAEMETPIEGPATEYAITDDGTVVEAEDIKAHPESFQDAMQ